jgi:hypothetical protein
VTPLRAALSLVGRAFPPIRPNPCGRVQFEIPRGLMPVRRAETQDMEYKKPFDQLYDPHKKAQDAIDQARDVRKKRIADLDHKKAETEPRLIADGTLQRCSVCGCPFPAEVHPSMTVVSAEHLLKAHKLPGVNR